MDNFSTTDKYKKNIITPENVCLNKFKNNNRSSSKNKYKPTEKNSRLELLKDENRHLITEIGNTAENTKRLLIYTGKGVGLPKNFRFEEFEKIPEYKSGNDWLKSKFYTYPLILDNGKMNSIIATPKMCINSYIKTTNNTVKAYAVFIDMSLQLNSPKAYLMELNYAENTYYPTNCNRYLEAKDLQSKLTKQDFFSIAFYNLLEGDIALAAALPRGDVGQHNKSCIFHMHLPDANKIKSTMSSIQNLNTLKEIQHSSAIQIAAEGMKKENLPISSIIEYMCQKFNLYNFDTVNLRPSEQIIGKDTKTIGALNTNGTIYKLKEKLLQNYSFDTFIAPYEHDELFSSLVKNNTEYMEKRLKDKEKLYKKHLYKSISDGHGGNSNHRKH